MYYLRTSFAHLCKMGDLAEHSATPPMTSGEEGSIFFIDNPIFFLLIHFIDFLNCKLVYF